MAKHVNFRTCIPLLLDCTAVVSTAFTQASALCLSNCKLSMSRSSDTLNWHTLNISHANLFGKKDRPQSNLCGLKSCVSSTWFHRPTKTSLMPTTKAHHILCQYANKTMERNVLFSTAYREKQITFFGLHSVLCIHSCLSMVCRGC